MEVWLIVAAFGFGFGARLIGLPPLVGYLAAGFVLSAFGYENTDAIQTIADMGVLLLLFSIGLKLKPRSLAAPSVWGTTTAFAVIGTAIATAVLLGAGSLGLPLAKDLDVSNAIIIGFALSFCSTVFAVKSLEETGESASLGGRLAVGILILQDILAVLFLVVVAGDVPSPWALALIPGFFVFRPVLRWVLDRSGHGEVLILFGFALAIGVGSGAFAAVGLKADLGALVAGLLLSGTPGADEMSNRLLAFKDLFLVGFFLSIGLAGAPTDAAWVIGALAVLIVPLRSVGLIWLFTRFRLRARTALNATLSLSTFSEFGLIVAAAALAEGLLDQTWLAALGVAVAGSFILGAATNQLRYRLYDWFNPYLQYLERSPIVDEDAVIDCGYARVLVFGMGRIGSGAYDQLIQQNRSAVVGIDRDQAVVERHIKEGRKVLRGDAIDRDFWERIKLHPDIELVFTAMSSHEANLACVRRIREFLPNAKIASIASYPDQIEELREAGVDVARNLYEEAGQALADDALSAAIED